MLEPGSIVLQKETWINGVNPKDNKKTRLSVILFEFTLGEVDYICSSPISNRIPKKNETSNLYIPYQILGNKKLCNIKLNRAYIYTKKEIIDTGLKLNKDIVLKMYTKLLEVEENKMDKEHYIFIKDTIKALLPTLKKEINKSLKKKQTNKK